MPREIEQPAVHRSPDAALSALLCLLHAYASHDRSTAPSRLGQQIYFHLEGLSRREDLSGILQQTCDELSDAWQAMLRAGQEGAAC